MPTRFFFGRLSRSAGISAISALLVSLISAALPASAWTANPVGDSVTMMETGDDYHVEIGCHKAKGRTLSFEMYRFFPPVEELKGIRSVSLRIEQGQKVAFAQTIDVAFSDERDAKVTGELFLAPDELETLAKASRLTISDGSTGKLLFTSQMKGTRAGRNMFREHCGI